MDELINGLLNVFSPATLIFCIVVYLLVSIPRKTVEVIFKDRLKSNTFFFNLWRGAILNSLPLFVGGLLAWILPQYPYPDFALLTSNRIVFGIFCGGASGIVYASFKKSFSGVLSNLFSKVSEKLKTKTDAALSENKSDTTQESVPPESENV